MTAPADDRKLTPDQRSAFLAALLGWTMDAFDYFVVVLVYAEVAKDFGVSLTQMAFLTTVTLIMRPVGALLFGLWADRVGRRIPLIVDVCFYSVVGFLCAFAPNFTVLLVLRLLYGIGMGGEWGLGAALAMEKIPARRRGFFSGVLQQGYSLGYLLAALASLLVTGVLGLSWRWLFALSIVPALISLIIRARVQESEVWRDSRVQDVQISGRTVLVELRGGTSSDCAAIASAAAYGGQFDHVIVSNAGRQLICAVPRTGAGTFQTAAFLGDGKPAPRISDFQCRRPCADASG